MKILFGHPGGNPNSHHAALAHFETHRLEAFCVPWTPSSLTLKILDRFGPVQPMARRLARRRFDPLAHAPKIQGRIGELRRLITRAMGCSDEALSYEANDWLMRTMKRECKRGSVSAVHAYEDCALLQFIEAKRLGKACIYDMPIGYYPAWENMQTQLARKHAEWLPVGGTVVSPYVRPQQKLQEMELADIVMAPSSFVIETIRKFHPNKVIALAPYGVDLEFWKGRPRKKDPETLRFIYAGQVSLRKGIPDLLQAWEKAALRTAELHLIGSWLLNDKKRVSLPPGVVHVPACSPVALRDHYRAADVFVFPSFFEGFGLVLLEAMACGLPAIASNATAGPDVLTEACGRVLRVDDPDALIDALRWFDHNRDQLPAMSQAARRQAEMCTWERYRQAVVAATAEFV